MRKIGLFSLLASIILLTGCAANPNVDIGDSFLQNKPKTLVIVTTKTDVANYYNAQAEQEGQLFVAIDLVSQQKLEKYLKQMDINWYYQQVAEDFQQELTKENIHAVIASEHPYSEDAGLFNNPKLNRASIAGEYNADEVLVLSMPYYGVRVPMGNLFSSPPMEGACVLFAELSDPQKKTIYWRHTSSITKPIPLPTNQPPAYPNVTQTILASQKMAREELIDSFLSGQ